MADAGFAGTDRAESRDVSRIFGKHQGVAAVVSGFTVVTEDI